MNLIDCPARKLLLRKSKLPTNYNSNKVLADFLASKLNASLPLECNPLDNSKANQSLAGWTLAKDDSNVSCNIADEVVIQKQLLNIAEAVNKTNNKIKDLEPIFRVNITLCSMQKMEESLRIKILSKYFNEATDDSELEISMCENSGCDYFFIKDLIKYTPENQQLNLLRKIRENNFDWFKKLYSFGSSNAGFGNDVEMNQVAEIYLEVSKWIIKYYDQLNISPTVKQAFKFDNQPAISNYYPGMQPYILGKGDKDIVLQIDNYSEININETKQDFLDSGKVHLYNQYMMTDLSPKIYDPNNPPSTASLYKYFDYNETYDPYEPVTIICGLENQFGLEVKKEIVMPAIAAFAYQAVLQEESKHENLRQFGNVVMITTGVLATPFSGGTSLAGVIASISTLGIAVGSIDAYMTSVASSDSSFKESSFYKAWDTTYTTYSMIDGAGALTNLAVTGYNVLKLNNFAKSYNAFETAISGANTFQNSVFGERLNQLRNIFKNASTDLNLLKKGKTFSNYISKINTGFKKTFLATVLTLNLNVNATDNILQLSNNANKIETVLNLSGKTEQLTDAIKSTITSKSDEIVKAFDNQSVVSIKTSPNAQAVDGKFVILNVGQDNILATLINNQIKINFVKTAADGYHIYEYAEDKDPTNSNSNPKCTFCPDKIGNTKESELCKKLEQLASNTQNSTAVHKLCAKGIDIAVLNKVLALTTAKQKVFVDDFANTTSGNLNKLQYNGLFEIWESFATETNILAGEMRARYIRDLTSLAADNIDVVKQMIAFRKQLYQVYTNLGLDYSEITKKNIAFAEISYEVNGQLKTIDNILSISGRAIPPEANINAIALGTNKTITPTASNNRFYAISGGGQDSEAKIFEYFMDRLAREKDIKIPNGADRKEYVEQILSGSKVKINITTEMSPCSSCATIIVKFNSYKVTTGAEALYKSGVIYP